MKKELRRQLEEEHVYINEMYDNWQKVAQLTNQTGKEFRGYLQSIQSNLLDLDEVRAPNETHFIHRIRQGFRSEIRAALYRNPTVSKDWPTFFEAVANAKSSIHLEHKTSSHEAKFFNHNKEKQLINLKTAIIVMVVLTNLKEPTFGAIKS